MLSTLAKTGTKPLSMNINGVLLDRVDKYRFKRMFRTRSEAIEFLLDFALKINPERSKDQKPTVPKGEG
jgi:metal-responsive CopG/Arc/MetJ family transcriptional regulator